MAATTKESENPVRFYKYRSLSTELETSRVEGMFKNNLVYYSSADSFNDPFEFRAAISFDAPLAAKMSRAIERIRLENRSVSVEEARRLASDKILQVAADKDQIVSQWRKEIGVYSLSARNDNILMWSHYAGSHSGICVEFSLDLEAPDEAHAEFIAETYRVRYQDSYPSVNFWTTPTIQRIEAYVLTKARQWSYEKEWRKLDPENGPGLRALPAGIITGITLGLLITEEKKDMVVQWARDYGDLKVYQAQMVPNAYSLRIEIL